MKKFIICLLAIAMIVLCFTGCRDDKNGTNSENVSETDAESTAETVEGETPADGEAEKQEEEKPAPQPMQVEEEDEPLVIVPEGETIGGDDLSR